jgi:hypothetical protein
MRSRHWTFGVLGVLLAVGAVLIVAWLMVRNDACVVERGDVPRVFAAQGIDMELKVDFGQSFPQAALQAVFARKEDISGGRKRLGVELYASRETAAAREEELRRFPYLQDRSIIYLRNANAIVYYYGPQSPKLVRKLREAANELC